MNNLLKRCAFKLTYKKIDESKLNIMQIKLKEENLSYFNLSSNSIISFHYNKKLYYFRECPQLLDFKSYFTNSIEKFFKIINKNSLCKENFSQKIPIVVDFNIETVKQFKKYIDNKKKDKKFISILSKTDVISEKYNFSIWNDNNYDSYFLEKFGLSNLQASLTDIAVYFLWYMKSVSSTYKTLKIAHGSNYSYFSAVRSVSSRIIAEELNLAHMITNVRWCSLELDNGNTIFGLLSDSAVGNRMKDISVKPNGTLQRELTNLNILDLIMFQTDHGPNNYNVNIDKNENYSICAFDNDNPYTFFPLPFITMKLLGCNRFVNNNGIIIRPFFDRNTANKILNLNLHFLKERLKPYLNFLQIKFLIVRIKKLQKAIIKTNITNNNFLLDISDWNEKTLCKELSGDYGETYMTKALNK